MACFKSRESIIRERIDKLKEQQFNVIRKDDLWKNDKLKNECYCIGRAIDRMYKLIHKK